jgi:hypothetical protein
VFFDGTGDFLSLPCGDYINYGTGDFTVEFWINTKGSGGLFAPPSTITTTAWDFSISGGNFLWRNRLTATTVWSYSAAAATDGLWHHVAVARQSSSSRLFIDGSLVATNTDNNNWNGNESGKTFTIGQSGLGDFTGYLSNVRFVKGIALYTGTFTPSTTPLQPVNSYTNFLVCQSRNFVDNSASNRALTANGNVSVQKLGPFKSPTLPTPYYSNYFDGTGDYLTIAGNNAFNLYTGDWTIEYWFYHTGDKLATHISQGEYNWRIAQDGSSITVTTQITTRITATAIALYMWHHLALVSYNGTITLYIDGVSKGTTTAYPGNDSGSTIYIGRNPATTAWDINGYLSNIRIVKGTAVYTSAFTPPTSPLTAIANTSLLTCQSSTFIDNSTNNFTITVNGNSQPTKFNPFTLNYSIRQSYTPSVYGGSMYFDGSLDSLALTTTTPLTISTSPFTMEAWIYPTSFAHAFYILVNRVNNSTGVGTYYFAVETTGTLNFNQLQGPAVIITTAAGVIPLNAWTHVAVVRNSSNVWYLYVNGVSSGTTAPTNAYDFSSTNTTYIGYNPDANVWSSFGYLSDVRIIKGEAIYTSNFVPSSAPMSAIKNTVLLANGTGAGIYDSSENTEFETIGDAKLSTTTVKFSGTTSIYFDGTGDYLSTSTNLVNFAFGTGDFTVEMWVYQTSLAAAMLVDFRGATNNVAPTIELTAAGKVLVYKEGTGTLITSTNSITAATWTNVAVTRSGTSLKVFINGVQDPTTATDSTNWSAPSGKLTIGANKDAGSLLNGYLSDFRITKGAARYTATFTPSTAPFPTK